MAHSRRFGSAGRSRSMKTWIGQITPIVGSDLTPGASGISGGTKSFGAPFEEDATILRTRGSLVVGILEDGAATGEDIVSFAVGIGLVTAEAALAGAMPLPYDNPSWDGWFYYETFGFENFALDSAGTGPSRRISASIDSKAMRKIQSGMVFALGTQMATGLSVGSSGLLAHSIITLRILLKTS